MLGFSCYVQARSETYTSFTIWFKDAMQTLYMASVTINSDSLHFTELDHQTINTGKSKALTGRALT